MKEPTKTRHNDVPPSKEDNGYLIGFENGIYDLTNFEFRDRKPEDHVTMSVGYDYLENYSNHKTDLIKFLEDIIPNETDRDFLLKYTSTGLTAYNKEEIVIVLLGQGLNGKSIYTELVSLTLGQYFTTCSSDLLTERMDSNCLQLELMAFKDKRFVLGELPANGTININTYQLLARNNDIVARRRYEKEICFESTHKFGIICNSVPIFDREHDARHIVRKMRYIEFPTSFVENPTKSNEKQIDKTIIQKLELWKQDFMLLLIEKYRRYCKEGL
jgi:putative DNA primase/helicase